MARRVRDGLIAEGCTVLDAGMVATEMLYYLVGSRELDGGAMVTASHNPKAYTGVKLVREGALALSGDAGIGDVRAAIEAGLPEPPGGGTVEAVDVYDDFQRHAPRLHRRRPRSGRCGSSSTAATGWRGRWSARCSSASASIWSTTVLGPRRRVPRPRAEPAAAREPRSSSSTGCSSEGADLGIAWDGDADRCFFIDDRGEFVDGDFLTALLAQLLLGKEPGATILYDVRASRAVPDTVRAARRHART